MVVVTHEMGFAREVADQRGLHGRRPGGRGRRPRAASSSRPAARGCSSSSPRCSSRAAGRGPGARRPTVLSRTDEPVRRGALPRRRTGLVPVELAGQQVHRLGRDGRLVRATVVRLGRAVGASSMSSKPTTATSSGTRTPWSASARSAPSASRSLKQNTASGAGPVEQLRHRGGAVRPVEAARVVAHQSGSGVSPLAAQRLRVAAQPQPCRPGRPSPLLADRGDPPAARARARCSTAVRAAATLSMATWSTGPPCTRSPSRTMGGAGRGAPLARAPEAQRAEDDAVDEVGADPVEDEALALAVTVGLVDQHRPAVVPRPRSRRGWPARRSTGCRARAPPARPGRTGLRAGSAPTGWAGSRASSMACWTRARVPPRRGRSR